MLINTFTYKRLKTQLFCQFIASLISLLAMSAVARGIASEKRKRYANEMFKIARFVEREEDRSSNRAGDRHHSFANARRHRRRSFRIGLYAPFVHARREYLSRWRGDRETLRGHSGLLARPWQWTIRPPLCPRYINCLFEARWPPRIWLSPSISPSFLGASHLPTVFVPFSPDPLRALLSPSPDSLGLL